MLSFRPLSYVNASRLLKISHVLTRSRVAGIAEDRRVCGNREVVGHGVNGSYIYADITMFPFPSIRFRENTPEILALREKERGDWRRLSIEEKKTLYRASFCLTFAEMHAPTGQWKSVLATVLFLVSVSFWLWIYTHIFVNTKAPISYSEDRRAAQYWKQEAINNQPFTGNYKPKNADKYKPVPKKENGENNIELNDEKDGGKTREPIQMQETKKQKRAEK